MLRLCPALLPLEVGRAAPALPPPKHGTGQTPGPTYLSLVLGMKRLRGGAGVVGKVLRKPPARGSSWDTDGSLIPGLENNSGPRSERKCSRLDGRPIATGQFHPAATWLKWPSWPTNPERSRASRACCGHIMVATTPEMM